MYNNDLNMHIEENEKRKREKMKRIKRLVDLGWDGETTDLSFKEIDLLMNH